MNNIASSQLYSESLSTPRLRLHLVLGVDEVAHQTAVPLACATHVARTQQCAWWKVHGVGSARCAGSGARLRLVLATQLGQPLVL